MPIASSYHEKSPEQLTHLPVPGGFAHVPFEISGKGEFIPEPQDFGDRLEAQPLVHQGKTAACHNVIDIMEEQKSITQMGGTMRLGAYDCELVKGSRVYEAYGEKTLISERHRHRYEFNNAFKEEYEQNGMQCVGINPAADLVEIVEIPEKKWYIGTQFHPEYSSTVLHPHPLFMSFIKACVMS